MPIVALLRDYITRKRERGLLDFDDLLLHWRALLAQPALAERLRQRWDHVLVDEYQDVNQIQVDIVTALRPDGDGLTVVGDDAQAVYGFRGASSGHLLELAGRLPDATVLPLQRNFRSRQPVLDLANVVRPSDGGTDAATVVRSRRWAAAAAGALSRCRRRGAPDHRRRPACGRGRWTAERARGADACGAPQ